jgi:hypothetical protein
MADRNPTEGKISGDLNPDMDTQPMQPVKDGLKALRSLDRKEGRHRER